MTNPKKDNNDTTNINDDASDSLDANITDNESNNDEDSKTSKKNTSVGNVNVAGGMTDKQKEKIISNNIKDAKASGAKIIRNKDGSVISETEINGFIVRTRIE